MAMSKIDKTSALRSAQVAFKPPQGCTWGTSCKAPEVEPARFRKSRGKLGVVPAQLAQSDLLCEMLGFYVRCTHINHDMLGTPWASNFQREHETSVALWGFNSWNFHQWPRWTENKSWKKGLMLLADWWHPHAQTTLPQGSGMIFSCDQHFHQAADNSI